MFTATSLHRFIASSLHRSIASYPNQDACMLAHAQVIITKTSSQTGSVSRYRRRRGRAEWMRTRSEIGTAVCCSLQVRSDHRSVLTTPAHHSPFTHISQCNTGGHTAVWDDNTIHHMHTSWCSDCKEKGKICFLLMRYWSQRDGGSSVVQMVCLFFCLNYLKCCSCCTLRLSKSEVYT